MSRRHCWLHWLRSDGHSNLRPTKGAVAAGRMASPAGSPFHCNARLHCIHPPGRARGEPSQLVGSGSDRGRSAIASARPESSFSLIFFQHAPKTLKCVARNDKQAETAEIRPEREIYSRARPLAISVAVSSFQREDKANNTNTVEASASHRLREFLRRAQRRGAD